MSRKTKTTRKRRSRKAPKPSFLRRWWEGISLDSKAGTLQVVLRVVFLCLVVATVGWTMGRLESYVRSTGNAKQNSPVGLQVSARPDWMPAELSHKITQSFAIKGGASYDDADLTESLSAQAASNPWVRKVRSVRKARDSNGRPFVRIDCEFRRPVAIVAWGKRYYFVDEYGVRLRDSQRSPEVPRWTAIIPGRDGQKARQENFIELADVPPNSERWSIEYVLVELDAQMDPAPPQPGTLWKTKALVGNGLRLAGLLKTLNTRGPQQLRVDARNYAGRRSTAAPHLAFWAGDSYFKFGRFPLDNYHYNVAVEHKMKRLKAYVARYNGRLAGTPGLDLQIEDPYE
jgi:hypothetical protein